MTSQRSVASDSVATQEAETTEEINPFVKRVVTVKQGDVVIFKYLGRFKDQDMVNDLQAQFEKKMGEISFVVIDDNFDITVLKQSVGSGTGVLLA